MQKKITEVQRLYNTLGTMGKFDIYGNDGKSERLYFAPHRPFATEQATDFVKDCMQKIGFTDVKNDKTKNDFFLSVSTTIVCEYDLDSHYIKHANRRDIQALYDLWNYIKIWCNLSIPTHTGQQQINDRQHKQDLLNYLNRTNIK